MALNTELDRAYCGFCGAPTAWSDEDEARPWGREAAFLRRFADDPALNIEQAAMLRHCARRIESTAGIQFRVLADMLYPAKQAGVLRAAADSLPDGAPAAPQQPPPGVSGDVVVRGPDTQRPPWAFAARWDGRHFVTYDPIGPLHPGGIALIAAERQRQVEVEGWTPEHDDEHSHGELAWAADSYVQRAARTDEARANYIRPEPTWPWAPEWWKPGDRIRELVKAGALIAAEIDRLQRREA